MTTFKVGYLIGSLAKESINRKLAMALTRVAPEHLSFTEIPIRDLPLYSVLRHRHPFLAWHCCRSRWRRMTR